MFAHTNLITYESLYSSSYLLNENLLYDKLWGPSQRVVTLFLKVPRREGGLDKIFLVLPSPCLDALVFNQQLEPLNLNASFLRKIYQVFCLRVLS